MPAVRHQEGTKGMEAGTDYFKERNKEHILVGLSSSPSNGKIIRTAARMAEAFDCPLTAIFVETPAFRKGSEDNKARFRENCNLAESLGADIEIVYGDDAAYQIAEFARLSGVSKIVVGRSNVVQTRFFRKPALTDQLLVYAPEIDIHIIPDKSARAYYDSRQTNSPDILKNVLKSLLIFAGATLLCLLFHRMGFTDANIIMVYILGVVLTSVATSHQVYSLMSSVASVLIFNYLFTMPRFSFAAYETGYPLTFVVMFLTALITGTFAIRYKEQASQSAKTAYRTKILFDTEQILSKAEGKEELLLAIGSQIGRLLNRNIVVFDRDREDMKPVLFPAGDGKLQAYDLEREKEIVSWVFANNHRAGAGTDNYSWSSYMYFAMRVNERIYGVVGIEVNDRPLEAAEYGVLLSILGEGALAMENEKNAREKEEAALWAEREQLRANLLRMISHDLRTPLTSISGHASNLISNGSYFDEETKQQLYRDIYSDSIWLINLVENLLSSTKIEEGQINLRKSTELLSDIVDEAVEHCRGSSGAHEIRVYDCDDLLFVKSDTKLLIQVLVNLINNAIKYTPDQTPIEIRLTSQGSMAQVTVSDRGSGIPDEDKASIFEKFYCGSNPIADSRRSLGLGLYLCKAIIEAHNGFIVVEDNVPCGAVFRFQLPREEVIFHE